MTHGIQRIPKFRREKEKEQREKKTEKEREEVRFIKDDWIEEYILRKRILRLDDNLM